MHAAARLWSLVVILVMTTITSGVAQTPAPWTSAGGGPYNTHAYLSAPGYDPATQISPSNVRSLALKWSFVTSGDISATPTVEAGGLYVPDWGGMLYKLDPATGSVIWQHAVCDYTSTCYTNYASISRSSPAIGQNVIVIGDAIAHPNAAVPGSVVIGVNKTTGAKVWSTVVNTSSPWGAVLGSPVIYNNIVYIGTSSWEEGRTVAIPGYQPVFRGNVTALNADTGAIIWQFTTVPPGYAGGAVPGSAPAVWSAQNMLLVGTGNNYAVPAGVPACITAAGSNQAAQYACIDPTDYIDALLSLDLTTGRLNWSRRFGGADNWTQNCVTGSPYCVKPVGPDSDFAQAPMLAWLPNFVGVADDRGGASTGYMLAAGQKSSMFYALNPLDGGLFWSTSIGIGGMEWGSTMNLADHDLFYVALHNNNHVTQTIVGQSGTNPTTWNAGAWGALNARTGRINWMIPTIGADLQNPAQGGFAPGCMTFANRVVFAGSSSGVMVAMDAETGRVYWTFATGGTIVGCPAIYNDTAYWGTGYARTGVGKHMLYAFAVPGG
jgi:polyvinyl alcohol dehydrogenase (cytochrome)